MRTKKHFVIAVCVVAMVFSAPQLLRAAEGLTLDELTRKVEGLFNGQNELKLRVAAVETSLAPTSTRNATATAESKVRTTATARAHYRATQIAVADARKTAAARNPRRRATATRRPAATPQLALMTAGRYEDVVQEAMELSTGALIGATSSVRAITSGSSDQIEMLNMALGVIMLVYEDMLKVTPPSRLRNAHNVFVRGLKHCSEGAHILSDGVRLRKRIVASVANAAADQFATCTGLIERAASMMG